MGAGAEGAVEEVGAVDVVVLLLVEAAAELGLISAVLILTSGLSFLFLGALLKGAARRSVALIVSILACFFGRLSSSLDDPPSSTSLLTIVPSPVRSPNTDL